MPGRLGHAFLASALVVVGTGMYLHLNKEVTLVVDGRSLHVGTFADTVGEVLDRHDVAVGPHDEVAPAQTAVITDGMQIQVLHAKAITVVLNGESRTVFVTGSTVQDVLEHINVRQRQGDLIEPSRSSRIKAGDVIVYREAFEVRLVAEGQTRRIITNAPNVGYLLDSMGVVLRRRDRVTPLPETELGPQMTIQVTRVVVRNVTERSEIPYGTDVVYTDQLLRGVQQLQRAGQTGLQEALYRVRFADGTEVRRTLLERKVLRQPVDQVIAIGTRPPNMQEGIASWYDWDGRQAPCGGRLTGLYAAHKTLPCGTTVRVTNLANGATVTVVIRDRGPYISGRIIDLSDEAFSQIAPLGVGTVRVRITW